MNGRKIVELEAVRGIAAVIVLFHHLLTAFFPRFHGLRFPDESLSLFGTPIFAIVNGSAAVVLFFVLSGFVLTLRSFQNNTIAPLIIGAIKRWPRLVVPVLVVNLISGVLSGLGWYWNSLAAKDIDSTWLGAFFNKNLGFQEHIWSAAIEGSFLTFVSGHDYYNSSLWTMYYEFVGSFISLAVAVAMLLVRPAAWMICLVAILSALYFCDPYFACFPTGVLLAYLYQHPFWSVFYEWFARNRLTAWSLATVLVLVLFGYHESRNGVPRAYMILIPFHELAPDHTRVILHMIGSVAVLMLVLVSPSLGQRLRGPFGSWLGRISFPIYLVHVPVICSVGAGLFVLLAPSVNQTGRLFIACIAAAAATVLSAIPLMRLEGWWLRVLGSLTRGSAAIIR